MELKVSYENIVPYENTISYHEYTDGYWATIIAYINAASHGSRLDDTGKFLDLVKATPTKLEKESILPEKATGRGVNEESSLSTPLSSMEYDVSINPESNQVEANRFRSTTVEQMTISERVIAFGIINEYLRSMSRVHERTTHMTDDLKVEKSIEKDLMFILTSLAGTPVLGVDYQDNYSTHSESSHSSALFEGNSSDMQRIKNIGKPEEPILGDPEVQFNLHTEEDQDTIALRTKEVNNKEDDLFGDPVSQTNLHVQEDNSLGNKRNYLEYMDDSLTGSKIQDLQKINPWKFGTNPRPGMKYDYDDVFGWKDRATFDIDDLIALFRQGPQMNYFTNKVIFRGTPDANFNEAGYIYRQENEVDLKDNLEKISPNKYKNVQTNESIDVFKRIAGLKVYQILEDLGFERILGMTVDDTNQEIDGDIIKESMVNVLTEIAGDILRGLDMARNRPVDRGERYGYTNTSWKNIEAQIRHTIAPDDIIVETDHRTAFNIEDMIQYVRNIREAKKNDQLRFDTNNRVAKLLSQFVIDRAQIDLRSYYTLGDFDDIIGIGKMSNATSVFQRRQRYDKVKKVPKPLYHEDTMWIHIPDPELFIETEESVFSENDRRYTILHPELMVYLERNLDSNVLDDGYNTLYRPIPQTDMDLNEWMGVPKRQRDYAPFIDPLFAFIPNRTVDKDTLGDLMKTFSLGEEELGLDNDNVSLDVVADVINTVQTLIRFDKDNYSMNVLMKEATADIRRKNLQKFFDDVSIGKGNADVRIDVGNLDIDRLGKEWGTQSTDTWIDKGTNSVGVRDADVDVSKSTVDFKFFELDELKQFLSRDNKMARIFALVAKNADLLERTTNDDSYLKFILPNNKTAVLDVGNQTVSKGKNNDVVMEDFFLNAYMGSRTISPDGKEMQKDLSIREIQIRPKDSSDLEEQLYNFVDKLYDHELKTDIMLEFRLSDEIRQLYTSQNIEIDNTVNDLYVYQKMQSAIRKLDSLHIFKSVDIQEDAAVIHLENENIIVISKDKLDILVEKVEFLKQDKIAKNILMGELQGVVVDYPYEDFFQKFPIGAVDELLLPQEDFDYSVYRDDLIDPATGAPRQIIQQLAPDRFVVKKPAKQPLRVHADLGRKYLEVDTSLMKHLLEVFFTLWQQNIFKFGAMNMRDAVERMLEYLKLYVDTQIPNHQIPQGDRIIQLFRWYGEASLFEVGQFELVVDYGPLKGNMHYGRCDIPHEFTNVVVDPVKFILGRENPSESAVAEFIIDNPVDTKFEASILSRNGDLTISLNGEPVEWEGYNGSLNKFEIDLEQPAGEPHRLKFQYDIVTAAESGFFISNPIVHNYVYSDFEMEYLPKAGTGNRAMDFILKRSGILIDLYDNSDDALENVKNGNMAVAELVDRLVEYFNLHHTHKVKGKRLTIKK